MVSQTAVLCLLSRFANLKIICTCCRTRNRSAKTLLFCYIGTSILDSMLHSFCCKIFAVPASDKNSLCEIVFLCSGEVDAQFYVIVSVPSITSVEFSYGSMLRYLARTDKYRARSYQFSTFRYWFCKISLHPSNCTSAIPFEYPVVKQRFAFRIFILASYIPPLVIR